jgi:hypothetical protein
VYYISQKRTKASVHYIYCYPIMYDSRAFFLD